MLIAMGTKLVPVDLVDADRGDIVEAAVGEAPGHGHLDCAEDVIPTGLECVSEFFQGKALDPLGKKSGVGGGQVILPFSPRYTFHLNAATRTIDPPHGVQAERCDSPSGTN
jgi:hypothetical protein